MWLKVYTSRETLNRLEKLFDINLKSKGMRRNQSVMLSPSDSKKIADAMKGIDPRKLASVKGFGRKTVKQVEDLLMHHYIYNEAKD
jgi:hypothetical protein